MVLKYATHFKFIIGFLKMHAVRHWFPKKMSQKVIHQINLNYSAAQIAAGQLLSCRHANRSQPIVWKNVSSLYLGTSGWHPHWDICRSFFDTRGFNYSIPFSTGGGAHFLCAFLQRSSMNRCFNLCIRLFIGVTLRKMSPPQSNQERY